MVTIEEAKRRVPELTWEHILPERWFAQPENTVGGWCVTLAAIQGTPADGNPPIACFTTEDAAKHIARIHNYWIDYVRAVSQGKAVPSVDDYDSNSQPPTHRTPQP